MGDAVPILRVVLDDTMEGVPLPGEYLFGVVVGNLFYVFLNGGGGRPEAIAELPDFVVDAKGGFYVRDSRCGAEQRG